MKNLEKYKGVIPAFYACYDDAGDISPSRVRKLSEHLMNKGVRGLYVCGSSGESVYQNIDERKQVLENVMEVCKGKITVIAHVAASSTRDSAILAEHAQSCGVDAIAAIPPIYYRLPDYSVMNYWNAISDAASDTDFFIYNIPSLAGIALSASMLKEVMKNTRVIGIKNTTSSVQDIQRFKSTGGENIIILNGPDEQYLGGRLMGAEGGIGGTYCAMPELFVELEKLIAANEMSTAQKLQFTINDIIEFIYSIDSGLYSAVKHILNFQGVNIGCVRAPLTPICKSDYHKVEDCARMIEDAIDLYKTS